MKKLFLIALLFSSLWSHAQDESVLSKYSYCCYYLTPFNGEGNARIATGFFYKKQRHLYFISVYHALTGMDTNTGKIRFNVDTIFIRYTNNQYITANDILKVYTNIKIKPLLANENPDLGYLEIDSKKALQVNLINDLIDKRFNNKIPDSALTFGFPSSLQAPNQQVEVKREGFTLLDAESAFRFLSSPFDISHNGGLYDLIMLAMKLHYLNSMTGEGGLSGSPVIGIHTRRGKKYYYLSGVIRGVIKANQTNRTVSQIIKSEYLFAFLKSLP